MTRSKHSTQSPAPGTDLSLGHTGPTGFSKGSMKLFSHTLAETPGERSNLMAWPPITPGKTRHENTSSFINGLSTAKWPLAFDLWDTAHQSCLINMFLSHGPWEP